MTKIKIASSDPLSTFYTQARLVSGLLARAGVIDGAEVLETTGSIVNAEMTADGRADLGFMASNWVARALAPAEPFAEALDIAVATPLNAGPLFFIARADSPLSDVRELRGLPIAVGHANSGMAQHARNIVTALGWGNSDIDFSYISTFDGGNALAEEAVAAQFSAPIPSTHFEELTRRLPVKVLRFDEADIAALCDAHPFYSPALVPAEHVPGLEGDAPALGVLNVIVARATADPELIRAIVAAFIAGAEELEAANALFRGLPALLARARERGREALAPGGTPLHDGAAAAFRAAGLLS